MDDLIKNAVKTKNITNKNKMPDYMLKERIYELWHMPLRKIHLSKVIEIWIYHSVWEKDVSSGIWPYF